MSEKRMKYYVVAGIAVVVLGVAGLGWIHVDNNRMARSVDDLSSRLNQLSAENDAGHARKEQAWELSHDAFSWETDAAETAADSVDEHADDPDTPIVVAETTEQLSSEIADFFHLAEKVRALSDVGEVGDFDTEMLERGLPLLSKTVAALGVHEEELSTNEGAARLLSNILVKSLDLDAATAGHLHEMVAAARTEANALGYLSGGPSDLTERKEWRDDRRAFRDGVNASVIEAMGEKHEQRSALLFEYWNVLIDMKNPMSWFGL